MPQPKTLNTATTLKTQTQPANLLDFIGAMVQQDLSSTCRRQFSRHSVRTTLSIQPLNLDFLPAGDPFSAVSSDLSLKGMAFVNPEPIVDEYVRIGFVDYAVSVISQVRHNSSIGVDFPLFLVGVEFFDECYQL